MPKFLLAPYRKLIKTKIKQQVRNMKANQQETTVDSLMAEMDPENLTRIMSVGLTELDIRQIVKEAIDEFLPGENIPNVDSHIAQARIIAPTKEELNAASRRKS